MNLNLFSAPNIAWSDVFALRHNHTRDYRRWDPSVKLFDDDIIVVDWDETTDGARGGMRFVGERQNDGSFLGFTVGDFGGGRDEFSPRYLFNFMNQVWRKPEDRNRYNLALGVCFWLRTSLDLLRDTGAGWEIVDAPKNKLSPRDKINAC